MVLADGNVLGPVASAVAIEAKGDDDDADANEDDHREEGLPAICLVYCCTGPAKKVFSWVA